MHPGSPHHLWTRNGIPGFRDLRVQQIDVRENDRRPILYLLLFSTLPLQPGLSLQGFVDQLHSCLGAAVGRLVSSTCMSLAPVDQAEQSMVRELLATSQIGAKGVTQRAT